ncbi:MAG: hypothetical protein NVSMB52_13520 [Chloroflexota bacterium]
MLRVCISFLTLTFLFWPSLGLARPGQAGSKNVLLARHRTEPVVAVDPRNPSTIVAAANTNYSAPVGDTLPTAFYASQNGGRSFVGGTMPMVRPFTTGADTTVQIDRSGTVFYSYLGETPSYCSGGRGAILLAHSVDHGRSYRVPVVVDANPADDKPNLAVESFPHSLSHLMSVWTRWHDKGSDIWFSRSIDGGEHFTKARMLHTSLLDNFGPVPVVGPGSRVYVFWAVFPEEPLGAVSRTQILMRTSTDDGAHFGPARPVTSVFGAVPRMAQPGSLRNLTMPAVAVDGQGRLFVAWSQVTSRLGHGEVGASIQLIRSSNGGQSWSTPARVNDTVRGDRFMPAIAAWPDGSVGLAFYDRRNSMWGLDVYAARVTYVNSWRVSGNVRVTRGVSHISDIFYIKPGSTCFSPGRFFGDYIGVAPSPHRVLCVVWADTQLHAYNETDLWFSRAKFSD